MMVGLTISLKSQALFTAWWEQASPRRGRPGTAEKLSGRACADWRSHTLFARRNPVFLTSPHKGLMISALTIPQSKVVLAMAWHTRFGLYTIPDLCKPEVREMRWDGRWALARSWKTYRIYLVF